MYENRVVLSVDAAKTGKEIKEDLATKLGIDVGRQALHYQGRRLADDQSVSAQKGEEIKKDPATRVGLDFGSRTRPAVDQSVSAQKVSEGARRSLVGDHEDDRLKPTYNIVYEDEEDDEDLASKFDHAIRSKLFRKTHFEADPFSDYQSVSAQKVFEGARSSPVWRLEDIQFDEVLIFDPVSSKLHVRKCKEIKKDLASRVDSDVGRQTRLADDQSVSAKKVFDRGLWSFKWSCGDGPKPIYYIPDKDLAPQFDYDFTDVRDDNRKFERGGRDYKRPCGWVRYGLSVRGRYSDDVWLGEDGIRTWSSPGEWAVSYHGTPVNNIRFIADGGYDSGKGKRARHGEGIYSSPSMEVAKREMYAKTFSYGGKRYKVVLQNRVNMAETKVYDDSVTSAGVYYVTPNDKNIRPYGVCIKKA